MSFTSETRERTRPILPLAGMVDVLFLLLIFFMTASVFREQEPQLPVDLTPSQSAQADAASGTQVMITVTDEGQIFLGSEPVTLDQLRGKLQGLAEISPNETIVIRGDQASRWGMGLRIMDMAQQAGLRDVRAATVRPKDEPR